MSENPPVKPTIQSVERTEDRILTSDLFEARERTFAPRNGTGTYREPARDLPIYHSCDVLVVGGGPSGTAAAWAGFRPAGWSSGSTA